MKFLLICISVCTIFIVLERQILIEAASLVYANLTHDMSHLIGDQLWVARYNGAIWLSGSGRYAEAKKLLTPILNDTTLQKSGEIAELYGDLLYSTSGSLDDVLHMYERSLSLSPSDRVMSKIALVRGQQASQQTASGARAPSPGTSTGSQALDAKKIELQKISLERGKYIDQNSQIQDGASVLRELVESAKSGSTPITQDW